MNLKKIELIVVALLVVIFLAVGTSFVFAADVPFSFDATGNSANAANNSANELIPTNSNKTNTSKDVVPNTGLEDLPWVVIGIVALSAVFAYKKIKEYNID